MFGLVIWLLCITAPASSPVLLSDVHVHSETGDVLGTEATLEFPGNGLVVATIRHFEGGCEAEVVHLSGTLNGEAFSASGSMTAGTLSMEGKLTKSRFVGKLLFRMPRQTNVVAVRLPVVQVHRLCRSPRTAG